MIRIDSKDKLEKILDQYNIEYKWINHYGITDFSRTIQFKIRDNLYTIVWFHNESTLYFGKVDRNNPSYPFKYIGFNNTHPCHNDSLQFGYKNKNDSFLGPRINWNSIIIPL